ncbi:hypothetical protein QBC41DRAFT_325230 [Cercophora samala]|uniref:NAD(P)-binding protein n=1 Tax=Cercophora samala TaxID=330535 RepID=A0AA39Z9H3_9PEZI|nr:hypothetical protein QBC41DRAFT_325230 [Cercophora samala]
MADSRADLTSRVLPTIVLGAGTHPALQASDPYHPRADPNPAVERFKVSGVAIVAGGAGDLGTTATRALLEHGVEKVAIFDVVPQDTADDIIKEHQLRFPFAIFQYHRVDITDDKGVKEAVNEVRERLGSINILLNFVGIVCCEHAIGQPLDSWRRTIDVNTTGSFIIAQAVAQSMAAAGLGGSIILVASISGSRVNFPQPQAAYNASKAAVIMMMNCLAVEWAQHGIRVNTISPGYMNTILNEGEGLDEARKAWFGRNPMGRIGEREELSGAVVLLASRAGSYITGADIVVDGGQSLL